MAKICFWRSYEMDACILLKSNHRIHESPIQIAHAAFRRGNVPDRSPFHPTEVIVTSRQAIPPGTEILFEKSDATPPEQNAPLREGKHRHAVSTRSDLTLHAATAAGFGEWSMPTTEHYFAALSPKKSFFSTNRRVLRAPVSARGNSFMTMKRIRLNERNRRAIVSSSDRDSCRTD
jgi:hypothetical protein